MFSFAASNNEAQNPSVITPTAAKKDSLLKNVVTLKWCTPKGSTNNGKVYLTILSFICIADGKLMSMNRSWVELMLVKYMPFWNLSSLKTVIALRLKI